MQRKRIRIPLDRHRIRIPRTRLFLKDPVGELGYSQTWLGAEMKVARQTAWQAQKPTVCRLVPRNLGYAFINMVDREAMPNISEDWSPDLPAPRGASFARMRPARLSTRCGEPLMASRPGLFLQPRWAPWLCRRRRVLAGWPL